MTNGKWGILLLVSAIILSSLLTYLLMDRKIFDNDVEYKIVYDALRATDTRDASCKLSHRIPRVIYRTGRDKKLSVSHQKAWNLTAQNNPEYVQILYTDAEVNDFMANFEGGWVKPTYDALVPGAARADLFRYCIIYENGGVYLDLKSGAYGLDDLIRTDDRMIVSTWPTYVSTGENEPRPDFGEFQQWWLVCEAKHPIIHRLIETIVRNVSDRLARNELQTDDTRLDVLQTTGPLVFTDVILNSKCQNAPRVTLPNGNRTFVYDVAGDHPSGKGYSSGPLLKKSV